MYGFAVSASDECRTKGACRNRRQSPLIGTVILSDFATDVIRRAKAPYRLTLPGCAWQRMEQLATVIIFFRKQALVIQYSGLSRVQCRVLDIGCI